MTRTGERSERAARGSPCSWPGGQVRRRRALSYLGRNHILDLDYTARQQLDRTVRNRDERRRRRAVHAAVGARRGSRRLAATAAAAAAADRARDGREHTAGFSGHLVGIGVSSLCRLRFAKRRGFGFGCSLCSESWLRLRRRRPPCGGSLLIATQSQPKLLCEVVPLDISIIVCDLEDAPPLLSVYGGDDAFEPSLLSRPVHAQSRALHHIVHASLFCGCSIEVSRVLWPELSVNVFRDRKTWNRSNCADGI